MKLINPRVKADLDDNIPIGLHLGAGEMHIAGHYNVDLVELPGIDIVADLNSTLDLLPDNSVNSIYTRHTFEHIDNFIGLMAELHRVCSSDATITIVVPHFSNPYYYSDPTHVRSFGLYSMHYFMEKTEQPGRRVPAFYTGTRFSLISTRIDFYRTSLLDRLLVPIIRYLVNFNFSTQEFYERRWIWLYPAWQIQYVITKQRPKN